MHVHFVAQTLVFYCLYQSSEILRESAPADKVTSHTEHVHIQLPSLAEYQDENAERLLLRNEYDYFLHYCNCTDLKHFETNRTNQRVSDYGSPGGPSMHWTGCVCVFKHEPEQRWYPSMHLDEGCGEGMCTGGC